MRITIDTETEELEELRHLIAIIEDAIKRRESFGEEESSYAEETESPEEETQEADIFSLPESDYEVKEESRTFEIPQDKTLDKKNIVKDIIDELRNKTPSQPIYMSDIISQANSKNIDEEETRRIVNELQNSGSI